MPCMKRVLASIGMIAVLAASLFAADASGKWKGSFDAGGTSRDLTFDLKASGDAVSGNVFLIPDKPAEVKDGKIKGDNVSFWFMTEYNGNPIKLVCTGKVGAAEINFNMGLEDGQW